MTSISSHVTLTTRRILIGSSISSDKTFSANFPEKGKTDTILVDYFMTKGSGGGKGVRLVLLKSPVALAGIRHKM